MASLAILLAPGGCLVLSGYTHAAPLQIPRARSPVQDFAVSAAQNPPPAGEAPPAPTARPPVIDPKAQQLLDKAILWLGGPAFLQFKTMTSQGRTFSISNETTAGMAPFTSQVQYPDKRRFTYGTTKPVALINNGDGAWELDQYGVTHQLPEQVRRWQISNRYSLENLLRLRIHEPGVLVQLGGVDFVDNLPARIVEIIDARQVDVKLYLNSASSRPMRITYSAVNPATHEQDDFADVYTDYREIGGVQTPMHISRFINDERLSELFRSTARYGDTYPPETFEPVQ